MTMQRFRPGTAVLWLLAACAGGDGKGGDSAGPGGDSGVPADGGSPDGGADGGGSDGGGDGGAAPVDADKDGYTDDVDCDDADPAVHPDAVEVCNGIDDDCDGAIDDADTDLVADDWFGDADGDGYGSVDERVVACEQPDGTYAEPLDCDGTDPTIHPGGTEVCNTLDDDCDGAVDEDVCAPMLSGTVSASVLEGRVLGFDGAVVGVFGGVGGDTNGDGVDDVLAGTWDEADEPSRSGRTFVVPGPLTSPVNAATVGSVIYGTIEEEAAGIPSPAGDVDHDGYDDILVRSLEHTYLVEGPVSSFVSVEDAMAFLPSGDTPIDRAFPHGVGDTNGDGYGDVMVGNTWASTGDTYTNGEAWLYQGPVTGLLGIDDADATLIGPFNGSQLGYIMDGAGDMDGDGLDDVAVSDHYYDGDGAVFVQYAPFEGDIDLTHDRDVGIWHEPGPGFRGLFSSGADFDGDGYPDIVVGSPDDEVNGKDSGAAYLFYGPLYGDLSSADADVTIEGQREGVLAGGAIELSDDMNLDGAGELAVAGRAADELYADAFGVYVFHGPLTGTLSLGDADLLVVPATEDGADGLVAWTFSHGDVTGDHYPDLVFGNPYETLGGTANGVMWVVPGGP